MGSRAGDGIVCVHGGQLRHLWRNRRSWVSVLGPAWLPEASASLRSQSWSTSCLCLHAHLPPSFLYRVSTPIALARFLKWALLIPASSELSRRACVSSGPTATGPAAEVPLLETDGAGGPPVPAALAQPGCYREQRWEDTAIPLLACARNLETRPLSFSTPIRSRHLLCILSLRPVLWRVFSS